MTNPVIEKMAHDFKTESSTEVVREIFERVKKLDIEDQKLFVSLTQEMTIEEYSKFIEAAYDDIMNILDGRNPELEKRFLTGVQLAVEFSKLAKDTRGDDAPAICDDIAREVGKLDDSQYNDAKELLNAMKRVTGKPAPKADKPKPKRKNPFP